MVGAIVEILNEKNATPVAKKRRENTAAHRGFSAWSKEMTIGSSAWEDKIIKIESRTENVRVCTA